MLQRFIQLLINLIALVQPQRKTILDTTSDDFVEETDDLMENVRRRNVRTDTHASQTLNTRTMHLQS